MYNSKKNSGYMESSPLPVVKLNANEAEKEIGSKLTDFQIICEIGRGSYGGVYRVQSLASKNEYAMKKINMKHVKLKHQKEALKEVQILKKVRNSHIIQYYTSFVEDDHLYIIMELAEGGDLAALIKQHKERRKHFTEKQIWDFAWELCHAIDYLHNNNIIHRDIKTLNIFLTKDGHIKLGDLGVSKIVSSAASLQGTRVGTPLYLSPELVKQLPYDFKVDIWALGCVLYHLAALEPPFCGDNLITLGYNIVHKAPKSLPDSYSPKLVTLIMRFLEKNPSSRAKISETYDLFPQKVRSMNKSPSTSTADLSDSNKIEYHTLNSAKLLKVEDNEIKKFESNKPSSSWVNMNKKGVVPATVRPTTTAGVNRILTKEGSISHEKLGLNQDGGLLSVRKISPTKVRQNKISEKSPSPRKVPQQTDPYAFGTDNHSFLSKKELDRLNTEQKGQADKKHIDTESTVENKPRTLQLIMANNGGNDTTLSAQQVKDNDNLKRFSKKQESNIIIEENIGDRKNSMVQKKTSFKDLTKPVTMQSISALQAKDLKESVTEPNELKRDSNSGIVQNKNKNEDISSKNITQPSGSNQIFAPEVPLQRPENRPYTSDAAKRIMMNPLIKSHSPRVKITSKFQQGPSLPYSQSKRGHEGKLDNEIKTGQDLKPIKQNKDEGFSDRNTSNSKEIRKENSNFLENFEEGKKKTQTPGFGNEIRIRPVSAHILKRMHNNLVQTNEDKSLKEDKIAVYSNSNSKNGDVTNANTNNNNKLKNGGSSNIEPAKDEQNAKGKSAAERPKSAVFVGRLGNKPAQAGSNRDQNGYYFKGMEPEGKQPFVGGWWKNGVNPLMAFGYAGLKKQDVLKEEVEDSDVEDDKERSAVFRKSGSSFMRFEFLGKPAVTNPVEVIKKPSETSVDWGMKDEPAKGIRIGQARPATAVASKKRLTIHDLM